MPSCTKSEFFFFSESYLYSAQVSLSIHYIPFDDAVTVSLSHEFSNAHWVTFTSQNEPNKSLENVIFK